MSYSLDPYQAGRIVGPDLGPNCLPRLTADNTGRQRFNLLNESCWHSTFYTKLIHEITENHFPSIGHCKVHKFSDTRNFCCNLPKIQTNRQNLKVFHQKEANGIANREDPDQTAPLGAV